MFDPFRETDGAFPETGFTVADFDDLNLEIIRRGRSGEVYKAKMADGTNILLGNDMEAKIADFGITKFILDTETHMTSSKLVGSLGYIAHEYYQTMKFDKKCDIYSFSVVLAVLVMGKLLSDEFFQKSELSLLKSMMIVITGEDPLIRSVLI
ncbi:leucine-rich repeat receptor-like serine/threonine/tyrosine-protein kinase SOBIR1 [Tanacetum coccineum]